MRIHATRNERIVRRARERRNLHRTRHPGKRVSGRDVVEDDLGLAGEALPRGNRHVGGHQETRLAGQR